MLLSVEMIHVTFLAESTSSPYLIGDWFLQLPFLLSPASSSLSSSSDTERIPLTFAGTLSFLFLGDVLFDLADDAQLPEKLLFDTAASEVAGDLRPVGGSFLLLPLLLVPRRPADLPIGAEALVPDEMLLMLMSVLLLLLLVLPILVPVPVLLSTHAAALWNGKGLAAGLRSRSEESELLLPKSSVLADAAAAAAFFLVAAALVLAPPRCRFVVAEGGELAGAVRLPTAGDCPTDGLATRELPAPAPLSLAPLLAPGRVLGVVAAVVGVAAAEGGGLLRATNAATSLKAPSLADANLAMASSPLATATSPPPSLLPLPLGLLSRPSNRPTARRAIAASSLVSNTPMVRSWPPYEIWAFHRPGVLLLAVGRGGPPAAPFPLGAGVQWDDAPPAAFGAPELDREEGVGRGC